MTGRHATRRIALTTLLVADYDAAIAWYTRALGFRVFEDRPLDGGKRWVRIGPGHADDAALLLAEPANDAQRARVGDQTGGRDRPQPRVGGGAEDVELAPEARHRRNADGRQRQDRQGDGRHRTVLL